MTTSAVAGSPELRLARTKLAAPVPRAWGPTLTRELVIQARGPLNQAPDPGVVVPHLLEQAVGSLRQVSQQNGSTSPAFEELTAHDQAVLYLLPGRLSAREIGSELGVTRNTIKTHIKSLYPHLGATGRREAVGRGRRLGLLSPR